MIIIRYNESQKKDNNNIIAQKLNSNEKNILTR